MSSIDRTAISKRKKKVGNGGRAYGMEIRITISQERDVESGKVR